MSNLNINDVEYDPDQEPDVSPEQMAEAKAVFDETCAAYDKADGKCTVCGAPMDLNDWDTGHGLCDPCWRAEHDREMAEANKAVLFPNIACADCGKDLITVYTCKECGDPLCEDCFNDIDGLCEKCVRARSVGERFEG